MLVGLLPVCSPQRHGEHKGNFIFARSGDGDRAKELSPSGRFFVYSYRGQRRHYQKGFCRRQRHFSLAVVSRPGKTPSPLWPLCLRGLIFFGLVLVDLNRNQGQSCATIIPASISPQPSSPRDVRTSPRISQPARAANTASRLRMIAAWVGGATFWATTWSV